MKGLIFGGKLMVSLVAAGALAAGPVSAQKPAWQENGKPEKQERKEGPNNEQNVQTGYPSMGDHGKNGYGHEPSDHPGQGKKGPGHSGNAGKGKKGQDYKDDSDHGTREHAYFSSRDREVIHDYYSEEFRAGHCPPGLAKKRNGCMPPGQAKKWEIGHRLPRDVIFHDLSPRVLRRLPPPPPRHRYVRVAEDILLITTGVGMVVDAIEDLGRIH